MRYIITVSALAALSLAACDSKDDLVVDQAPPGAVAIFNKDGQLMRPIPTGWVFVSASATETTVEAADNSMAAGAEDEEQTKAPEARFNIIHIDVTAWAVYQATENFPEGTVLTTSFFSMSDKNMELPRLWADQPLGIDVAVKDKSRFADGWGYFRFTGDDATATASPKDQCFDCHLAHGETDNVFTQLYEAFQKDPHE